MNVLDYPTVVIPVTVADKRVDLFDKDYKPLNEVDEKSWKSCEQLLSTYEIFSNRCHCHKKFELILYS
jgi:hypothetical protein